MATTYAQAAELNSAAGNFTVSRTGSTSQSLTVNFAITGSATTGSDYASLDTSVTIPAGSSSANVSVVPNRDNSVESPETVVLTLTTSQSYTVGTSNSGTVTIADDPPVVAIQAWDATATEVGTNGGEFRVSRSGGDINSALTVNFAVGGSATQSTDYPSLGTSLAIPGGALYATLDVSPVSDGVAEATETVIVTLTSGASYVLGTSTSSTVTIDDGPTTVTVTALVPTANEADGTPAKFRVGRSGGDQSQPLTVYFSVSGTATSTDDYLALGTSVTIAAGASIADIELIPLEDGEVEDAESAVITLASNAAYQLGTPSSATVMIEDDLPTVMIVATDGTATELNETVASLTVQLSSVTPEDVTVSYSVGGSATPATDYVALSGTVTIQAGHSDTTITITPLSDVDFESAETVLVTLTSGAGYQLSDPVSATVSIADQAGPITLEAGSDVSAVEGAAIQRAIAFADPWGQSWSVAIDYGDGTNPSVLNLNAISPFTLDHIFADNGQFTVTVTVTAQDGRTVSDTLLVTVANVAPALNLGGNQHIGSEGAFSYSGSFIDPGCDTWTATVNYGSGSESLTLEGQEFTLSHAYSAPGVYPVTVTIVDDDQEAGTSTFLVTVNAGPQLDLNAANTSTTDFTTVFVEDGSSVSIANVDAAVTDVDDAQLSSIAVRLVNREDVAEILSANASGTSIQVAYSDSTLWLTAQDTLTHYQQVLRTVSYSYAGNRMPLTSRVVSIVANDGLNDGNSVTATVTVQSVNDAPHAIGDDLVLGQDVCSQILLGDDGDGENTQPLALTIVIPPAHGRLSSFDATSGMVWFTPDPGYIGTDSVSYSLAENAAGGLASTVVSRAITLVRTNNAPAANAAVLATSEDHVVAVALTGDDGESDLEQVLTFRVTTLPAHGTLTNWNPATGIADYTPDPGYSGSDSFAFTVTDDSSLNWPATTSAPATVSIAITPVNDVPQVYGGTVGVGKNIATIISLGDDGDGDYVQVLSLVIVTPPSHGALSGFDAASGKIIYTPQAGYLGTDSFSFRLSDDATAGSPNALVSATGTIAIEVAAAPIATAGQATTTEDSPITFTLVADDGDAGQNRVLTYLIATQPAHGTLVDFDPVSGTVTFVPEEDFNGADSLQFQVSYTTGSDATILSAVATVTLNVTAVNDAPLEYVQSLVSGKNEPVTLTLGSDDDPEAAQLLSLVVLESPLYGTISGFDASEGTVVYTPNTDFTGADHFTFTLTDDTSAGGAALTSEPGEVQITVKARPVAMAQDLTFVEDAAQSITLSAQRGDTEATLTYRLVKDPLFGEVTAFNEMTGALTYVPAMGFSGSDSLSYEVVETYADGQTYLISAAVSVSFTATAANDAPVAVEQSVVTATGFEIPIALAGDDADADADQVLTFTLLTQPAHGTIANFDPATGDLIYVPAAGYFGTDSFSFTVTDDATAGGAAATSTAAAVAIYVAALPTADSQAIVGSEDTILNVTLTGADGDTSSASSLHYVITAGPSHGTLGQLDPITGAVAYIPDSDYSGPDSFSFAAIDDLAAHELAVLGATAVININVTPVNDAPAASDQSLSTPEGQATSIWLGDGGDPESTETLTLVVGTAPSHGTLSGFDATTGLVVYTPAAGYTGSDTFTYHLVDGGSLASPTATVNVTIMNVNHAPVAWAHTASTAEDVALSFALSGSDGDSNAAQALTYQLASVPGHGELTSFNPATGTGTYTPAPGYYGSDTFTFIVVDDDTVAQSPALPSAPAVVTIQVTAQNDRPVAEDLNLATLEDQALSGVLKGNDDETDSSQSLTYAIVTMPQHGTITSIDTTTGEFTYTPNPNYFGTDSFSYAVQDDATAGGAALTSAPATVSLTVTASHADVKAQPKAATTTKNAPVVLDLSPPALTPGPQNLTYAIVTGPNHGSLGTLNTTIGQVVYSPSAGYTGTDTVTFAVTDLRTGSVSQAILLIDVRNTTSLPSAHSDAYQVRNSDGITFLDVLANDTYNQVGDLHVFSVSAATGGTASIVGGDSNAAGPAAHDRIRFVPNTGYTGQQVLSYTIRDASGQQSVGSLTLIVAAAGTAGVDGTPSVGGQGYTGDPGTTFMRPLGGNVAASSTSAGALSKAWTDPAGQTHSGTGTQNWITNLSSIEYSNADWCYTEIVSWSYDVVAGPAHLWGGYTNTLFAGSIAGAEYSFFTMNSNDHYSSTTTTSSGDATGGRATTTVGSGHQYAFLAKFGTQTDLATSFAGIHNQTSTTSADSDTTYSYVVPGGGVTGTGSGRSSTFDTMSMIVSWMESSTGVWTATGGVVGMGNGAMRSHYQGSGSYLTETATANSAQSVSGSIVENGNNRDSYYYLMTGSLQPDFEWSLNGAGTYSGRGSSNWSQSGSGTYANWGSGGIQEWSTSGSLSQNSWQRNKSRFSVGLSLESTGWTATDGTNTATGEAASYSAYLGTGSYTAASTTPEMNWSVNGVKKENGASQDGSRETRVGTFDGVAWTFTGSGSGQGASISNESNSGVGTLTQWMRDASGVVSGYVRGPMRESGSTQKSNAYHTTMALDSAGAWLTEGSGSGWSDSRTHSSYSARGRYVYDHVIRNAAQSGVEQTHSVLNSDWTKSPATVWVLSSGSGWGDNTTDTERSYSGRGTYTLSGWTASGMPTTGMLLPGADPTTGWGMIRWSVTTTTRADSGGDQSHSIQHLTMGVVDGAWKITGGWGSGSGESHASSSYTASGEYGYNTDSMWVAGTHSASGGYSMSTNYITMSSWDPNASAVGGWLPPGGGWVGSGLTGAGGWVTTGTATGSASDNLHTDSSGNGEYYLVRNLVNGESTASGTVTEDSRSDEDNSSQWVSTLPAGGDWTLSSGSGSSSGSSANNFALIGSGAYSTFVPTGSGSFSFLSERHFQDEYDEESQVVDGAWRITDGEAAGSGSSRDWYSSSGSGIFYRPSRWGGDTPYHYFKSTSTDDRFSFTKHATVGTDGAWHTTGSGTSSSSASNTDSEAVNRGKYQRPIDGGTIHGYFDDVETTLSLEDFTSHFELDANGAWVLTSGSGSSYGGAGAGQVFGGTGHYTLNGTNIYSDGASGSWSVQGTIQETGSRNATEGETWTHAYTDGSWTVVSKSGSGTEGDYAEFWNTASGSYARGSITGTFSRSEHDSSNSFYIFSLSGSGNGEPTATGSGSSHMSSFYSWSFAGGGTSDIGGTHGNLNESGAGESGMTEDSFYQRNGWSSWVQASGSSNIYARSRTSMDYAGCASYEYSGSTGPSAWAWSGTSQLSIRENSSYDDTSDYTYFLDRWILTDARFESASGTAVRGSYSATGSYLEPYYGGSISGTMSASGHEETGTSLSSKNVYRSGSWLKSGSGTGWGDGAADYMYAGDGTYNYLGMLGSVSESGNSRTTSHGDKQYRRVDNVWKVKGTGTTTASGLEQYAFSGIGVYSWAIPGGVLTGTQQESGGEQSSYDYSAGWQLGGNEEWVLVSGSGGGTVNGEHHSAADASGSYSRLFDGDGILTGNANYHTQLDYSYSYGGTADVVQHAWVTSCSGQMSGTSTRLFSYSGSGARSYSSSDAHTSNQNTSALAEAGTSGDSEQFGWEWQDNPTEYTWNSVRAVTNFGSGTYTYSATGHSQYSYATGNIAGGNGTVTSGTTDSEVTQVEQQEWTSTTTYHQSHASGETLEWSETSGAGSGSGNVYTHGVSQWSWQSATSTSTTSKTESHTGSCGTELTDNYDFTANWSHSRASDGSVSLNGDVTNHVWGSGQISRSFTDSWSATYSLPPGSGSGSGGGGTYSTGDSLASNSTTPLPGYDLTTHTTGFYSGAYNQGRLIPTWLGGTPVSGSYSYYYPGGGGTSSSGGGGTGGQGGTTDPDPLEGGPWFVAVKLEVGSQFLVGPEGVLTMGEGQQATIDEIAAIKEEIPEPPSPYGNFLSEWFGENVVRPMVGDATLAGASDFQLFAGTAIFSSVLVVGAWLAPGTVAAGAVSGAVIGAGYNLAHQLDNGGTVDWGQFGNAFAAGGITGAFAGGAMGIGAAAIPGFCTAATVVGVGMGAKSLGNAYNNFNEGQTYTAAMDAALGAFALYGAAKGAFGCFAGGTLVVCMTGRPPCVAEDRVDAIPEPVDDSPWWSDASWWIVVASSAILAVTVARPRRRQSQATDDEADSDLDALFASWGDSPRVRE